MGYDADEYAARGGALDPTAGELVDFGEPPPWLNDGPEGAAAPAATAQKATTAPAEPPRPTFPALAPVSLEWTDREPPEPRWFLKRVTQWKKDGASYKPVDESETGFMQRGTVALCVAPGGTGKSYALLQLAVAAALGARWLNTFPVEGPGRVLLVVGEETEDIMRARLWAIMKALKVSESDRALLRERLHIVALYGHDAKIMEARRVTVRASRAESYQEPRFEPRPFGDWLKANVEDAPGEWACIILDPASQFMPGEAETDNATATQFIKRCQRLSEAPGSPAVFVAHHTNKAVQKQGEATQHDVRGSSALVDGARLVVSLRTVWRAHFNNRDENTRRPTRLVELVTTKGNYGPTMPPIMLDPGPWQGVLQRCLHPTPFLFSTRLGAASAEKTAAGVSVDIPPVQLEDGLEGDGPRPDETMGKGKGSRKKKAAETSGASEADPLAGLGGV